MEKYARRLAYAESISFLVLLLIAMPLKYIAHMPLATRIMGMIHGMLFIVFIFAITSVALDKAWPKKRLFLGYLASVLPFGAFILDNKIFHGETKNQTEAQAEADVGMPQA